MSSNAYDSARAAQFFADRLAFTTGTHELDVLIAGGAAADRCQVVDVRFPDDFEQGHVPGALNLPIRTRAKVRIGHPVQPSEMDECIERAEKGRIAVVFREVADVTPYGQRSKRLGEDCRCSPGRENNAQKDLHERGFSRPVWTQESENLPLLDREGDSLQCPDRDLSENTGCVGF